VLGMKKKKDTSKLVSFGTKATPSPVESIKLTFSQENMRKVEKKLVKW
jgi:hypothetical protein